METVSHSYTYIHIHDMQHPGRAVPNLSATTGEDDRNSRCSVEKVIRKAKRPNPNKHAELRRRYLFAGRCTQLLWSGSAQVPHTLLYRTNICNLRWVDGHIHACHVDTLGEVPAGTNVDMNLDTLTHL
jgi:hypothetical protein